MAKGITIPVASDTREFATGVKKGVITPLEGTVDALDDVAKAGEDAGEKLERAMEQASKETSDFKKEQQELARTIDQGSQQSFKSFSRESSEATDVAKQNAEELGNEAKANLAETLSSFDGTVQGTINGIQGTLGGVTAGLTGVIPIIAAAAGAAGLGLIATAFQKQSEEAEKVKGKVAELASEFIETGEIGERSLESMVGVLKSLATETEQGEQSLDALAKAAKAAGLEYSDIAKAYVGNSDALAKVIRENNIYEEQLREQLRLMSGTDAAFTDEAVAMASKVDNVAELNSILQKNLDVTKQAEQAELAYIESGAPEIQAKVERIKTINDAYDEGASNIEKYLNKEKQFDPKKYLEDFAKREKALADYSESLATVDLSPEAKAFIDSQGAEAAAQFLAGYKKAGPKTKSELNRVWTEAGKENSGEYLTAAEKGIAKKDLKAPKVATPKFDSSEFMQQAQADLARRPPLKVEVEYVDARTGKKVYK